MNFWGDNIVGLWRTLGLKEWFNHRKHIQQRKGHKSKARNDKARRKKHFKQYGRFHHVR